MLMQADRQNLHDLKDQAQGVNTRTTIVMTKLKDLLQGVVLS